MVAVVVLAGLVERQRERPKGVPEDGEAAKARAIEHGRALGDVHHKEVVRDRNARGRHQRRDLAGHPFEELRGADGCPRAPGRAELTRAV